MRCKKHKYSFKRFCWFCFCKFIGKPDDFAYYSGYPKKELDRFLEAYPQGMLSEEKGAER